MLFRLACRHLAAALPSPAALKLDQLCRPRSVRMLCNRLHSASSSSCSLQPLTSSSSRTLQPLGWTRAAAPSSRPAAAHVRCFSLQANSSSNNNSNNINIRMTKNPYVITVHSKAPRRPLLLPLQAAGTGGGAGGGGSKKGYSSGSGGSGSSGSGGLWESYNRLLEQYPLLVKAITTALLSAVGNLVCQLVVEGKGELDWRRFSIFTALGFVWVAPCLHFWFGTLNRLVSNPGNAGALMRMALDQLGFAPLFISSMIGILAGLDGKGLEQCVAVVKRDLPDAIKANWALWVPAQFINFRFVPASYQVLFANMVALLWNVYFSFATRPKAA